MDLKAKLNTLISADRLAYEQLNKNKKEKEAKILNRKKRLELRRDKNDVE